MLGDTLLGELEDPRAPRPERVELFTVEPRAEALVEAFAGQRAEGGDGLLLNPVYTLRTSGVSREAALAT